MESSGHARGVCEEMIGELKGDSTVRAVEEGLDGRGYFVDSLEGGVGEGRGDGFGGGDGEDVFGS